MNQGNTPNSGLNSSSIDLFNDGGKMLGHYQLTGLNSLAADPHSCTREFGCGYTKYTYRTNNFICERTLACKPSTNPYDGFPAFLLTVKLRNTTGKMLKVSYNESVVAHYEMMEQQRKSVQNKIVKYQNTVSLNKQQNIIKADIKGIASDPLLFPDKTSASIADGYPPSLFLKALSSNTRLKNESGNDRDELSATTIIKLKAHEEISIRYIIGYSFGTGFDSMEVICDGIQSAIDETNNQNDFNADWLKVLPRFPKESDTLLRNEMIWHAYNLEAMTKYNDYYKETEIPQGTVYDYDWGIHASARDHMQHALASVYYNPGLTRSVLRYMIKKTTPWGEIRLIEAGYGMANAGSYFTSDQQLYFFQLLSEYLRVTGDYRFLEEQVDNYPLSAGYKTSVLQATENCFKFLRDEIGIGRHGLVRLMNSDWNDAIYYIVRAPYNRTLYNGESHMNSAMAIVELDNLIDQLKSLASKSDFTTMQAQLDRLTASMGAYRDNLNTAFFRDLGDRNFSRRMYFNGRSYGDENLFLEPQTHMMRMKELPESKKLALLKELKERVYNGEKLGAREQQAPEFEDEEFDRGSRENGGFWYALNGPLIIGISMFDKPEAWRLLKKMSFGNYSHYFPNYWSSYWSASDNVESSLIPMEGLPDQTGDYSDIPVYCAHPHAWLLYCYYKLTEDYVNVSRR
ncbi:GH36-type glycosyl hydrolase domain-containing protein [Chitinophaga sp. YR573]|uniref:GH36-type glycosyl hydrolase domain-containing protein n=1 Tax=Chitinophaga sp. YR573 TaxID=1881040 RepID=UPI00115FDAF5|nr:hypothetical protein [Chitinophaga sp. YR573]